MNPDTGSLHYFENAEKQAQFEQLVGRKMIPLSEEQAKDLEPLGARQRKGYMRNQPCVCGSGVKFKKCCWHKYR